MAELEKSVRSIEQEGLVWGASTLVAVGYGIKKLQINLVVGQYPFDYCLLIQLNNIIYRGREDLS